MEPAGDRSVHSSGMYTHMGGNEPLRQSSMTGLVQSSSVTFYHRSDRPLISRGFSVTAPKQAYRPLHEIILHSSQS